jgi:ribosomal protein S18 acetylase RimI-like enzyme
MRRRAAPAAAASREMLTVVPATGELQHAALTLLYCRLAPAEREEQLASLRESVDRNEITLDNLLVAIRDGMPVGAILIVVRPGRMAFLWPPVVLPGEAGTIVAEKLLTSAASCVDAAGVVVTQCLLELDDTRGRDLLNSTGFPYCTEILLLSREVGDTLQSPDRDRGSLTFDTWNPALDVEFVEAVERTYVDSLDCPEIARYRSGNDALTSYRAAPGFDSALWSLVRVDDKAAGVLLAHDHPQRGIREIVYVGVVPEARRRGIGRSLLLRSLVAAAEAGIERCEVAVDGGNHYALSLYRSLGFEEERRFAVHLRLRHGS